MGLARQQRRSSRHPSLIPPTAILVLVVLSLGAFTTPAAGQSGSLRDHPPILIEGDADLCNAADVSGTVDADGIINCGQADGSERLPFLISGWNILQATSACLPGIPACSTPNPCSLSTVSAAVAICNTTKHVRLERLQVENRQALRDVVVSDNPGRDSPPAAGILLAGASNVRMRWINVTAAGIALAIEEGKDAKGNEGTAAGIEAADLLLQELPPSTGASYAQRPLLEVTDADVSFERLTIRENNRERSARFLPVNDFDEAAHTLRLHGSSILSGARALSARDKGVEISFYDAVVTDSTFGPAGVDGTSIPNVDVYLGTHVWLNNTFLTEEIALRLEGVAGRFQFNRFTATGAGTAIAIHQDSGSFCSSARITYNELPALEVQNEENSCTLRMPYNYWGAEPITSGAGAVERDPVLPLPMRDLPALTLRSPGPNSGVHGKFIVQGIADGHKAGALRTIEAADTEDVWENNVTAEGLADWILPWDATASPLGRLTLWIRACADKGCGVPAQLPLIVVERPLPPIALLEVTPRVAMVGEPVTLDASASYSPQARPITLYRFDLGNGVKSDWIPRPMYDVRYNVIGEFPASVEVLDIAGLQNTNLPQAFVRVRADPDEDGARNRIPAFDAFSLAAALAVFVLARRIR